MRSLSKSTSADHPFVSFKAPFMATLLLTLLFAATTTRAAEQPNILFVITDDQSYETLGHLGHLDIDTPTIDQLARSGTSFSHCYNMGSWSGAVCIASRTMLNTGRFVWNAHSVSKKLKAEHEQGRLWVDQLSAAGYQTFMTGKWHVSIDAAQVFDVAKHIRPGMPNQTPEGYNRPPLQGEDPWKPWDKSKEGFWKGGKHWSEIVADDAVEFLNTGHESDQPFFMYVAFNAPHDPRQAPKEFVDLYPLSRIRTPENFLDLYPYKDKIGCGPSLRDEKLALFPRTVDGIRVHRAEYFACITHLDRQLKRIFDALESSGKADSTIIVFTSDHGLAVGRHGLVGKQNMYEHSMRVPFIISGPGIDRNKTIETPIYMQDVVPTSIEMAGAENQDHVEFQSLLPLLQDESTSHYELIYGAYLDKQRMIHDGQFKLIVYPDVPVARLYNVKQDPFETKDLAEQQPETVRRLFKLLVAWQQQNQDGLDLSKSFPDLAK